MENSLPNITNNSSETSTQVEVFSRNSRYFVGDLVEHNGLIYKAIRNSCGEFPDRSNDVWVISVYSGTATLNIMNTPYRHSISENTLTGPPTMSLQASPLYSSGGYSSVMLEDSSVKELKETVAQLKAELSEIKKRLNGNGDNDVKENYRKIAVK